MTSGGLLALALTLQVTGTGQSDPCSALPRDERACDSAVAAELEPSAKARLLFYRAYGRVEAHRYEEALADLDEAIRLKPDYADAFHERAYVRGELREFDKAIADADREIALRPDHPAGYSERAFLRQRAGNLEGAFTDRSMVASLTPSDPDALVARAEAAMWLGRWDEAEADLDSAGRLAKGEAQKRVREAVHAMRGRLARVRERSGRGSPREACEAAAHGGRFERPKLVGDCTSAFLAAETPARKAEMLTLRSLAWLAGHQDQPASIADQEVAVGLDPVNPQWRANLGSSYVMIGHSWAAKRELDRSLAIKESWAALAQRAAARYNLKDPDGALADAKRSVEIEPNQAALMILGDIAQDGGDAVAAKQYWMFAWRLGARGEAMKERLKSIGIEHPEREPQPK